VLRRAEKLKLECLHGIDDKTSALGSWIGEAGLLWDQVLYIGNDVNDRGPLALAGLSACPSDAHPDIVGLADWVVPVPGGRGVLRAVADRLLANGKI
jgi:N-acylneuraminate cytidylyltransferase